MAQLVVTVPDAQVQRVLDAVAGTYAYDPDSGLTKAQFLRQHLVSHLKTVLVAWESQSAAEAARRAAAATADQVQIS